MEMLDKEEAGYFLLLYGSETGNSKAIAEQICEKAQRYQLVAKLHCFSETDKKFSIKESNCVVIICSTTGDGEPPQTVITFWRRIIKRTLPIDHLKGVYYTLLALGDSNYNNFCNFGKTLDRRLEELGAKKFYPTGYGDDAVDLEESVEPWIEGLWKALRLHLNINSKIDETVSKTTERIIIKKPNKVNMDNISEKKNTNNADDIFNLSERTSRIQINEKSDNTDNKSSNVKISLLRNLSIQASTLTLPLVPASSLTILYSTEKEKKLSSHNESFLTSAVTDFISATIVSAKQLTFSSDVKTTFQLTLNIKDMNISYEPGDSFGILCQNSSEEVEELLTRLKLRRYADMSCQLKFQSDKAKKKLSHLPECSTLRHIFTNYCEIRAVPKKAFLRVLSEHTYDEDEKQRLNELCSKEGSSDYVNYVLKPHINLLDLLEAFPYCIPPVEIVLEHLPKLKPRFYSVASSPLIKPDQFNILFNLVEIKDSDRNIKGVCTGWLSRITDHMYNKQNASNSLVGRTDKPLIRIYKKYNSRFHLMDDLTVPIIMIGPGSGIAPFIGFLQHRKYTIMNQLSDSSILGEAWLFYGCRFKDKDYLYKEELERFQADKILTKLLVSFSRDSLPDDSPKYVQHNIIRHATDIVRLLKEGCIVYVCGDAMNMSKDVFKSFIEVWKTVENCTEEDATKHMKKLQDDGQYLQDIWT